MVVKGSLSPFSPVTSPLIRVARDERNIKKKIPVDKTLLIKIEFLNSTFMEKNFQETSGHS